MAVRGNCAGGLLDRGPKTLSSGPGQEVVLEGKDVDLARLPVQTCWPGDAGPLITWGLTVTQGPQGLPASRTRQNLGIYRQQVIGPNKVIMRWLAHRGGALDFRDPGIASPGEACPVAEALCADPATVLAAVPPVRDAPSEFQCAGRLAGLQPAVRKVLHWEPAAP